MTVRALIVNDSGLVRRALYRHFSTVGYEVDSAASYDEAIELIDGRRYDLMSLDYNLGSARTGLDLAIVICNKLQQHPKRVEVHTLDDFHADRMIEVFVGAGIPCRRAAVLR